jgi:hypothetical protein
LIAHGGLLLVFDLAHRLILTLALLAAAFLVLPFAVRRLAAVQAPGKAILLGAVLLRLPLLPLPPALSDDVPRYLWDGKVAAAGFNPYALAPAAPELSSLRGGQSVPHAQVPTVYPPLAIAAFSIASRLPFPTLAWKALATGADLGACALLLALARRLGVAEARAAWYAWNPLPALEVAGMGHVDALGVAAALAAVLALVGRASSSPDPAAVISSPALRRWGAPACAAAAALVKLVPVLAFPLWSRASRRPWWFLAVAVGLFAAAVLPVVAATGGVPPGLLVYGVTWEFDGPLFEPLWRLLDAAGAAPWIAARLEANEAASRDFYRWDAVYPYLYPQLLAKLLLAVGALAAVALSLREREVAAGTGRLFGRLLLLSATVYPWYLLWVLPWAALGGWTAWLALSGLILLSYLPQHAGIPLMPWIYLAIWGPFAALLAVDGWRRRRGDET